MLSTAVACVLGFICLGDRRSSFRLGLQWVKDVPSWRKIAADGSPSALNNLFQTLRLLVINSLLMGAGGVLAGMENMHYRQQEIILAPGSCLFLYTDRVTETASGSFLGDYSSSIKC